MAERLDDIEMLMNFKRAVAEVVFDTPEEGFYEDTEEAKRDEEMGRSIVAEQLKAFGRRKREAARLGLEKVKAAESVTMKRVLPSDPAERRLLLDAVIASHPGSIPQSLTMAFRDGREISDAEVDGILTAFVKLGLLDPPDPAA